MGDGSVLEIGTHEQLMEKRGAITCCSVNKVDPLAALQRSTGQKAIPYLDIPNTLQRLVHKISMKAIINHQRLTLTLVNY